MTSKYVMPESFFARLNPAKPPPTIIIFFILNSLLYNVSELLFNFLSSLCKTRSAISAEAPVAQVKKGSTLSELNLLIIDT
jgi:hypothetical protein